VAVTASAVDGDDNARVAETASWDTRLKAGLGSFWEGLRFQTLTWALFALAAAALSFLLFPRLLDGAVPGQADWRPAIRPDFAFLVLCGCIAPRLLAQLSYSLITRRLATQTIGLDFSSDLDPLQVQRAVACWSYEIKRAGGSRTRAESFASLWGLVTTVALVGATTFLLPPFHTPGEPFAKTHNMVAFAVVGSASTRFLLDLARICIRISNDDVSKRMFAETLRTLILSVIATLALVMVTGLASKTLATDGSTGLTAVLQSMGLGAGVAIVGPPLFDHIVGRLSEMLGLAKPQPSSLTPLTVLPGLNAADIDRLAQEGLDSVEALVGTPPPRIFLNTRFSLQRISDWVDRGILICRLGPTGAAALQARTGILGALELRQMAMNLDGDAEAQLLLSVIVHDDTAAMLAVFRRTPLAEKRDGAMPATLP
jgi:hypothetical protein